MPVSSPTVNRAGGSPDRSAVSEVIGQFTDARFRGGERIKIVRAAPYRPEPGRGALR